jgi:DNA polymerase-1
VPKHKYFRNVVVGDFEYEIDDGDLPRVLCLVVYILDSELRHVQTIRRWRGEFGSVPPFDIGPDTLFVAYSAWAELTCFLQLGWKFPVHVYDLHTAFLSVSNVLLPHAPDEVHKKSRKRLSDACCRYGIRGWENIDKGEIAKAIGEGRWHEYGEAAVFEYCEEDVRKSCELLRAQLTGYGPYAPIDPRAVVRWSEYSTKSVARIQARGMPIDMAPWNCVQENKPKIITALIRGFDPSQGSECAIYSPDGEWSYERFARWLVAAGISEWPRLKSGALDIDGDAFRSMYSAHPAIEGLHALRDALGVIVRARIPIGKDGRNRPSLFPFATATGRNAQAKSLFNAHASMRSFMRFPVDKIGLYLDWRTQEVGVAAARSGDEALAQAYLSGDVYHSLALLCGLTRDTDVTRWKAEHKDQRQQMKCLQLGINYGMGVRSLARGLNRHPLIGSEIILRHQRQYPTYWAWRAGMVERAMLERVIKSEFDAWPLLISLSPNKRTLFNFPMQSGGAEMLRLAANLLCAANLVPSMLVHDGILLELDDDEQVKHAIEIMERAGAAVCGGLKIGVDVDQRLEGGARYNDKRPMAQKMWATVMGVLQEIGAMPEAVNAKL